METHSILLAGKRSQAPWRRGSQGKLLEKKFQRGFKIPVLWHMPQDLTQLARDGPSVDRGLEYCKGLEYCVKWGMGGAEAGKVLSHTAGAPAKSSVTLLHLMVLCRPLPVVTTVVPGENPVTPQWSR